MFVKFFISDNSDKNMSFERLICEYVITGRYKGE